MSNPEIASAFTSFLSTIPDDYQIVIGIDELDKLKSDDKAQQFLNEIKSVFGLPRCFYLISVSENAMSNFERRGLPFRDVFDSSFDSIVYVDYLNLNAAKELIQRRVVGKPVPFLCLSYCLSGGLPRDLIRTFRSLLEFRQSDLEHNDLSTLCRELVKTEIKAKVRAIAVSVKKIDLGPEVGEFLELLYQLEKDDKTALTLLEAGERFYAWEETNSQRNNSVAVPEKVMAKREALNTLGKELGTYIYYLVTLRQFFKNSLGKRTLQAVEQRGGLEDLARARQALAVDPNITRTLLNDFRKQEKLRVPSFLKAPLS